MASYNIISSSYLILTDQTGSTLTTSGQVSGSKYYTLIAPQYSTGSITVKLTSFSGGGNNDILRIYNDLPSKYTASFVYTGSTVSGQLIGVISGASPSLPQTFTATSGKAYLAWAPSASAATFNLEWTGSGFQTPDLTSSVSNRYALTFPKNTSNGSCMTFAVGRFTGSALTTNADIIFGTWVKGDSFTNTPTNEIYGIYSLGLGPSATTGPGIRFVKPSNSNNLQVLLVDSANSTTSSHIMTNAFDGGGGSLATQYIPQWHHYGFVVRKTSSTVIEIRGYKDGQIFSSASFSGLTAGGNFATTYDHVIGNYRSTTGLVSTISSQTLSGSIDDAFLITLTTGSTVAQLNNFFADVYNSGSWKDPTLATGSLSSSLNPKVQFAWRFEETGSLLNTKDYGTYGNIHSASSIVSASAAFAPYLTTTSSGYSYTAYPSLSYTLATPSNATVAFTSSVGSVYENTASFYIGVQAVTAAVAQSAIAAIQLSSSTNTASIGTDYTLTYNGTTYSSSAQLPVYITWSASDTSTKYITASIFDNTTYNVNGSSSAFLKIEQGSSTNVTAGSPFLFELKILDYEEGNPSFTSTSYSVGETTSSANFYISRLSGSNGPLTVYCKTVDGTALSGTNYVGTSGSFTWTDGDSSTKTGSVTILNDNIYSTPDKYFSLMLYNLSTGSFLPYAVTSSTITINDQTAGTFNWSVASLSAYETGTLATVNVLRSSGSYGAVTVNISGSSSLSQPIRTTMTGTLSFANNDVSKQFTIDIQDDLIDELDDIIYYKLYSTSSISGAVAYTGSQATLAFTLIDNETGSITFNTGSASVYENTSSYVFNIQRLYGGDQAETASISYTGTAVSGTHYNIIYNSITQSSPFNIIWSDQQKDTRYITASIIDNNLLDGTRNIVFSIGSSSISSIGPTSSFQLNILDYEITGSARFVTGSYTGSIPNVITIQLERYNGQDVSASAIVSVSSSSTAIAGVDYTNIFPYTASWNNQESGSKNIDISTISSWGGDKILNLYISSLTNLSSGSILSTSVLMTNNVLAQSTPGANIDKSYIIYDYNNLSSQFTRRIQQVPFSLNKKGTGISRKP